MKKNVWIVAAHPLEVKDLKKELGLDKCVICSFESEKPYRRGMEPHHTEGPNDGSYWGKHPAPSRFSEMGAAIELLITGIGEDAAEFIFSALKQKRPHLIINIGFAGALLPSLKYGDWVIGRKILKLNRILEIIKPDSRAIKVAANFFSYSPYPCHQGEILTTEEPIAGTEQRRELFNETKALVVDMEAYYLAKLCSEEDIAFLSLKTVSDFADCSSQKMVESKGKLLSKNIAQVIPELLAHM